MEANAPQRFIVRIEVYAAAGHVDLDVEAGSGETLDDVLRDIAQADPDEVEDQTYRLLRFDLCDTCRRNLLARPLG
jgi:hypothetical protein